MSLVLPKPVRQKDVCSSTLQVSDRSEGLTSVAPVVIFAAAMHYRTSIAHEGWPSLASRVIIPGAVLAFTLSGWLADILLVHASFKASQEVTTLSFKPSYWL